MHSAIIEQKDLCMLSENSNSSAANSGNSKEIVIHLGGYYISKSDGKYGLFRLLDFDENTYDIQIFQEKFDTAPIFDEIKVLSPYMWHVPLVVGDLLNRDELKLVGHEVLDEHALMGYEEYLRQMGVDEPIIKERLKSLIERSTHGPIKVKLNQFGDEAVVTTEQ